MSSGIDLDATPEGHRRLRSGLLYSMTVLAPHANTASVDSEEAEESSTSDLWSNVEIEEREGLHGPAMFALEDERSHPTLWEHVTANVEKVYPVRAWSTHKGIFYQLMMPIMVALCMVGGLKFFPFTDPTTKAQISTYYRDLTYCILVCHQLTLTSLGLVNFFHVFLRAARIRGMLSSFISASWRTGRDICQPLLMLSAFHWTALYLAIVYQSYGDQSVAICSAFAIIWALRVVFDGVERMMIDRGARTALLSPAVLAIIAVLAYNTVRPMPQYRHLDWRYMKLYSATNVNVTATVLNDYAAVTVNTEGLSYGITYKMLKDHQDDRRAPVATFSNYAQAGQVPPMTLALSELDDEQKSFRHGSISNTREQNVENGPMKLPGARTRSNMIMQSAVRASLPSRWPTEDDPVFPARKAESMETSFRVSSNLRGPAAAYVRKWLALPPVQQSERSTLSEADRQPDVVLGQADTRQTSEQSIQTKSAALSVNDPSTGPRPSAPSSVTATLPLEQEEDLTPTMEVYTRLPQLSEEEIIAQLEAEFDGFYFTHPSPVGTIRTYRYTGRDGTVTDHLHKMIYWTTRHPENEDIHTVVVYTPQASTLATWKQSQMENTANPINWLRWAIEWLQSDTVRIRDAYEDEIYGIKRAEAELAAAAASVRAFQASETATISQWGKD